MKEKLTIVVTVIRREKINRDEETFTEFLKRLRKKYSKAMRTKNIGIRVIEKKKLKEVKA